MLEVVDRIFNFLRLQILVRLDLTGLFLSFSLVGETLGVIELGISILSLDGSLEILMRRIEILFIQAYVTPVEVVVCTSVIISNGKFIFLKSSLHVTLMVEGQS